MTTAAFCFGFAVLGLLVGYLLGDFLATGRERAANERLIETIVADRDQARHEAQVFRGVLMPAVGRAEAASVPTGPPASTTSTDAAQLPKRRPRGISSRSWFNMMRRFSNTPQIKHDALVRALKTQVPDGGKANV